MRAARGLLAALLARRAAPLRMPSPPPDEAFVLLEPDTCQAPDCQKFSAFWDEMTGYAPPGFVGRRSCRAGGDASMFPLCSTAARAGALKADIPAVVVKGADGRYAMYAGERSQQGIVNAVVAAAGRAGKPGGRRAAGRAGDKRPGVSRATTSSPNPAAPGPPGGHDPLGCLERAFEKAGASETCGAEETCGAHLRPSEIARTRAYDDFTNGTILVASGEEIAVAAGAMAWPEKPAARAGAPVTARFDVLPGVLTKAEVADIRELAEDEANAFDAEPDSVDGMPSYEMFVFPADAKAKMGAAATPERRRVRERLAAVMEDALERRLTPFVRRRFAKLCGAGPRACTPCSSLVRRYREGERRSHAPHEDSEAFATVVVSLADAGDEYEGGLYLAASSTAEKRSLALRRGDAVVHRGDLLHGVDVGRGERWSWILWYRDSPACEDKGREWYGDCAATNPVCQHLHAGHQDDPADAVAWYARAAAHGFPRAMVKMARFYVSGGYSAGPGGPTHHLPKDRAAAAASLRDCVALWDDPDCNYGLAQMRLENATLPDRAAAAVEAFEAAARHGHAFAAYNLGVAHLHGHGVPRADGGLAAAWFEASGLPEGLLAASFGAKSENLAEALRRRAEALGAGAPWRAQARHLTGSGGTGGVALHSAWPGVHCVL